MKSDLIDKSEKKTKEKSIQDDSIEKLNDLLKKALDKEDYEQAAKIRDELGKRN